MICRYCRKFHDSELRENMRNSKGKIIHQTRYCPSSDDMKEEKNPSCDQFIPADHIWCDINDYWVSPKECFDRQKKHFEGCPRCKQKLIINELEERPKPILMKRTEKPILMKRRII